MTAAPGVRRFVDSQRTFALSESLGGGIESLMAHLTTMTPSG